MAIDVEKLIRDVRSANSAQTSARDDSGHVAVVQGKGSANSAQTSARDDNDPWYLKAAKWIDEHTTNDADVTFNYGALTNGNRTLTETAERAKEKSDATRKANSAAAEALRQAQKPESSGTTFGKDHVDTNKDGMSWWERLTANAANAADEAFGTYSPGNATSRSKAGNTVAGGLQETGGSIFEALGFVTDQKEDKTPTEADMAFGNGTLTDTLPFMKKFWQSISDKSYKQSDKLFKEAEESTTAAKDGLGTVGSFAVDAGKAATQLGADIVAASVSGGSALVPMAIRSFGGGLREARQDGWSKQEQFNYAVGSAAIETLTEKLSSVALPFKTAYGKGAVDDIVERLISGSVKTEVGRAALRTLFSAIGEGNEEMIADVLNPILKATVRYDTAELDQFATPEFWSQTLRDGLLGASIGVLGSGGQVVGAAMNSRKSAQNAASAPNASQITADMATAENGAQGVAQRQNGGEGTTERRAASDIVADVALGRAETQLNIDNADSLLEQQQASLPKGTGAAELGFTGEMTHGERWAAAAQGEGDSALHPISREQQQNLAEQQSRAPQELPKVDLMGNLTSKTASTIMNSGITPQEMSNAILEDAAQGRFSRIAYEDNAAINKANDEIENGKGRYQGALRRWEAAVDSGKVSKDTVVMGISLYNNAVTNGDFSTGMDILTQLVDIGKNTGQAMQAIRILNKLSPEGRIYAAAKAVDNINAEVRKRYGDKAPDISVDENLFAEYSDALKDGDNDRIKSAWEAIEQNIADQIPANWIDKLNAWRYLSMLGNVRTHARNFFGNGGFIPVRMTKNLFGAIGEEIADKASKNGIERTKAVLNPFSEADRALLQLTWGDYENSIDQIMSGGKYNNTFNGVEDKRTIFKFKPLEVARKANSTALNVEDSWFCQPAYAESLASWLKANGYDAKSFTDGSMPKAKLDAARDYAVKEAQKATYRDCNTYSNWVSTLKVRTDNESFNKVANAVIEGVIPFKKTPTNILVRAVEYSPIGLVNGIKQAVVDVKRGRKTAAEAIDSIAAGLTGTALVGLGVLLAKIGLLSGGSSGDDKQDSFDSLRGKQDYSLNIGDWSVSFDWLAPESMPVFVGVELFNWRNGKTDEPFSFNKTLDILSNITAPMLDMSMLQGVNDTLKGLDYSNGSALSTIITKATGSLVSQFFPTIFGQVERVFTPNRQTTYMDRNSSLSANTQRFIGNLANKIPGIDYNQIDYIDAWGRVQDTGNGFERFINNMINPANMKKSGATEVDDELQRLYDLGETGVYPQRVSQNTKIDGEYLSADEYVKYSKKRGQESLDTVRKLISSSAYKALSDADKAKAIESAYDYADAMAKKAVNSGVKTPSWVEGAKASGNAAQYIVDKSLMQTVDSDGNGSYSGAEKVRGLISGGYSGGELVAKVREYMTTESGNCELGDLLERAQGSEIPDNITLDVYEFESAARADKDENGKSISGSKKHKVFDYINSLNLSAQQKQTLYYSFYKN